MQPSFLGQEINALTLNREEAEELAWLLGKHQSMGFLDLHEEARLRELMKKQGGLQQPPVGLDELVKAGLILLGFLALIGLLKGR